MDGNDRMIDMIRPNLNKAPLLTTECTLGWSNPKKEIVIDPQDLRDSILQDEDFHFPEFEWLSPKDSLDSIPATQVLFKITYRKNDSSYVLELSKSGASIHCDSSYTTWHTFKTEIDNYFTLIGDLLNKAEYKVQGIRLRYINAFKGETLCGKTPTEFINEDLHINIMFPSKVQDNLGKGDNHNIFFSYAVDLPESCSLLLSIGEAEVKPDNQTAAVCDLSALTNLSDAHDIDSTLENLHRSLDTLFFELIEPIQQRFE